MGYRSPLTSRYASPEMSELFSPERRATTWRKLWVALAQAESELGLPVTHEQVSQLEKQQENIDLDAIAKHEHATRHDVMAHLHAFADLCPTAGPILHLGATSAYVTDNGDLLIMREALKLLQNKLVHVIRQLHHFAERWASAHCLGYTHLQSAQPTTMGKRATLWIQDLLLDLEELEHRLEKLQFLGVKGATGTQASFLQLFHGDEEKVQKLDARVAELVGFTALFPVAGQTYTRKQDTLIVDLLAGIAASASKCAVDLRLLMSTGELFEPRGDKQVGSSAMPHKRNPVRAERICSLSRFVIALSSAPKETHANQWLERSLDDSAGRRLYLPESFLATDGILNLLLNITAGLHVDPATVAARLKKELPALAMEPLLMAAVQKGGDRQKVHEHLREHAQTDNPLEAIAADPALDLSKGELEELLEPSRLVGRAPEQTRQFLSGPVASKLKSYEGLEPPKTSLEV